MEQKKEKLKTIFDKIQKQVGPAIKKLLFLHTTPQFRAPIWYQIASGGKRLRPVLAVTSCRAVGGRISAVLYPAAGLEILHNYTLIVDDIIDHSVLRRNSPTLWFKYGKSIAECIAVDYGASLFQAAFFSSNPREVSTIFSKTLKEIVEGEIRDILFEREGRKEEPYVVANRPKNISQKEYIKMITQKTASLFEACCEIGGVCAMANKKQIRALKNYGLNLGLAFQAQDDILDIFGEEKEFGKKIGKDIEERKGGNLVLMMAFKKLSSKDKLKINSIMRRAKITESDKKEVLSLISKTDGLAASQKMAKLYSEKAKKALKSLPQNSWSRLLADLADFVVARKQ